MQAFDVPEALGLLKELYPTPALLLGVAKSGDGEALNALSRLWLSEGVPFAFKGCPGLYESVRVWLARQFNIDAKELTLVGSGRQGFSLKHGIEFGRAFRATSDLDFTAITTTLFEKLRETYLRWDDDYMRGVVVPTHERQRKLWDQNRDSCPKGLKRGFIDPYKIPTWNRYPESKLVANTLWKAGEKLKLTFGAPKIDHLSLRVYRDWGAFIRQMAINIADLGKKIST